MIDENDYQNLKTEVRSIWESLTSARNELFQEIENLKAKAYRNDEVQQFRDYRKVVLRIHAGAQALVVGKRYEVWCSTCGRALGAGSTPLTAWREAATYTVKGTCVDAKSVIAEHLVDSDFVIERSETGPNLGNRLELRELTKVSANYCGVIFPKTIVITSNKEGHMVSVASRKFHVTITEVPE